MLSLRSLQLKELTAQSSVHSIQQRWSCYHWLSWDSHSCTCKLKRTSIMAAVISCFLWVYSYSQFSLSYALGKLLASRNRYCPRTNILAHFRAKWRLLFIYRVLSVSRKSIICWNRKLNDLATDESRYFAQPCSLFVNYKGLDWYTQLYEYDHLNFLLWTSNS